MFDQELFLDIETLAWKHSGSFGSDASFQN